MVITDTCSLDRWGSALARLSKLIEAKQQELEALLVPRKVFILNKDEDISRVHQTKERLIYVNNELDALFNLSQLIEVNYNYFRVVSNMASFETQLAYVSMSIANTSKLLSASGPQNQVLRDIENESARLAQQKSLGPKADLVELSRLQALSVDIPLLDQSDIVAIQEYKQSSERWYDSLSSEVKKLSTQITFHLELPKGFEFYLNLIGIGVSAKEGDLPVAPIASLPAQEPQSDLSPAKEDNQSAPLAPQQPEASSIESSSKYPAPLGGYDPGAPVPTPESQESYENIG